MLQDSEVRILMPVQLGHILALVGMGLLLWGGLGRQSARKHGTLRSPGFLTRQRWLHAAAFGFILAGLFLLWGQK